MSHGEFYQDIRKFNAIYKLQSNETPTFLGADRIKNFHEILAEEVEEGCELAARCEALQAARGGELSPEEKLDVLTDLSDWLGDIVVYCASEARRWGLPLQDVLKVIMESNFSKLDENGEPIYDARGKVMKGPGYWKPEARISEVLKENL